MSKFRTLFPEPHYSVASRMIPKLERTLLLCEILQNSPSNHFSEKEKTLTFSSGSPGIPGSEQGMFDGFLKQKLFPVIKN